MLGVKSVPIEFGVDGKHRRLKLKDTLELDVEAIEGGDKNRESLLLNAPFTPVPGSDLALARSTKHNYSDYGIEWNILVKMASIVNLSTAHNNYSYSKAIHNFPDTYFFSEFIVITLCV